eukprot:scaffold14406_cov84-Isochrysis_galbana.AAC.1
MGKGIRAAGWLAGDGVVVRIHATCKHACAVGDSGACPDSMAAHWQLLPMSCAVPRPKMCKCSCTDISALAPSAVSAPPPAPPVSLRDAEPSKASMPPSQMDSRPLATISVTSAWSSSESSTAALARRKSPARMQTC